MLDSCIPVFMEEENSVQRLLDRDPIQGNVFY